MEQISYQDLSLLNYVTDEIIVIVFSSVKSEAIGQGPGYILVPEKSSTNCAFSLNFCWSVVKHIVLKYREWLICVKLT